MTLLLAAFLSIAPTAWAAPAPVTLPPGESAAWADALTLAGLAPGAPGAGPWVEIRHDGATWTLRVRDVDGDVHEVPIEPPVTEDDREEIAFLAVSLLRPVAVAPKTSSGSGASPRPSASATSPKPAPKPRPAPTPPPAPVVVAPEPPPPPPPPGTSLSGPTPWAAVGGVIGARPGTTAQPALRLLAGVTVLPGVRLAADALLVPPASFVAAGQDVHAGEVVLGGGVWYGTPEGPAAGLALDATMRSWTEGGERKRFGLVDPATGDVTQWRSSVVDPTVSAELLWALPVDDDRLVLAPFARFSVDPVPTDVKIDGVAAGKASMVAGYAGVSLELP